jgi:methionyl-tRNA formyltransferase
MDGIEDGTLVPAPQSPDGVSTAAKLNVDDARVDWSVPAFAVDRRIRACTPAPGAWTTFRGERLKLGPVRPVESAEPAGPTEAARRGEHGEHGEPGEITPTTRSVRVATAAGAVELGLVQPAGKRMIPAPDWARGARLEAGERLA